MVEVRKGDRIIRLDLFLSSSETTNNRMALAGAVAVLDTLSAKDRRLSITYVSDSRYLVQGMTEWVNAWKARGWRRKSGQVENLELWQTLDKMAARHDIVWKWVRGHAGHAKNEYADYLAVRTATQQDQSDGFVDSGFCEWLASPGRGMTFKDYDPESDFVHHELASRRQDVV